MKILLTACHIQRGPEAFPLAQLLLKKYCEQNSIHNISIEIFDFYLSSQIHEVIEVILNKNIDILGIGVYLWNSNYYIELAKKLKQIKPEIIIVAGGPETRLNYTNFLKIIDYTIQGEGEHVFLQLIDKIISNSHILIPGLNTGDTQYIKDLSTLSSPYIDNGIDYSTYDGLLWELSRGCPFSCSFCFESKGIQGVRYYSLEKISKELLCFTRTDIKQIFVLDPTFNTDLERAKKILNLIIKTKTRIHFHFEIRAEFIDEELAILFSRINCSIQIGIQSTNITALKTVNRNLNPQKFKEKISILSKYNLAFGLDLIYGLPNDTFEDFKNSMEYVLNLQPNNLDIFPLSVLPGTKLFDQSKDLKLSFSISPPYTLISNETFTKQMMSDSAKLAKSCDFIYNKCKSTGWLMQVCQELKISQVDFIDRFSYSLFNFDSSNPVKYLKSFIEKNFSKGNLSLILRYY
jgi:hypothetical protein